MSVEHPVVLAVDDQAPNLRLLDAVLTPRGYRVVTAATGAEALAVLGVLGVDETEGAHEADGADRAAGPDRVGGVDLVLLDIVMPGMDGYEVCRRIRAQPATAYLPVVMVTASDAQQRLAALEAGADDFVIKPFDRSELLARVASLVRIKHYQDTIERQAAELAAWNAELEQRVDHSVAELERTSRLRHFLSPQLADIVVDNQELLESHRREVVVVFCDFHGFTTFAETSEPEEVMGVLAEYHAVVGAGVHRHQGTLERFTGDGIMVFFNDPVACDDAPERAVRMALEIDAQVRELAAGWARRGCDLTHRSGIAQGYATLGRIGFPGRFDYAAIGSVTNLAARLCGDAGDWEVRVTDRVLAGLGDRARTDLIGDVRPKGFSRPVRVHAVRSLTTEPRSTEPHSTETHPIETHPTEQHKEQVT
jgi:adenylate cyclase